MDANQETSLKDFWKKNLLLEKESIRVRWWVMVESFQQMINFTWTKWIPSLVANLISFENMADANGEIVAFATITNLQVIKENDKSF